VLETNSGESGSLSEKVDGLGEDPSVWRGGSGRLLAIDDDARRRLIERASVADHVPASSRLPAAGFGVVLPRSGTEAYTAVRSSALPTRLVAKSCETKGGTSDASARHREAEAEPSVPETRGLAERARRRGPLESRTYDPSTLIKYSMWGSALVATVSASQ
jgi:hypothetical protein